MTSVVELELNHSMARANLNKSEELVASTTTASKYIPKRPRITYLVKVPLNVSVVK